jgi:hypothetical protein
METSSSSGEGFPMAKQPGAERDFQRRASEVGGTFERLAEQALLGAGFAIVQAREALPDLGIEVDFRVQNRQGETLLVECKGSLEGPRPGLKRTDTVKKALCNAFLLARAGRGPLLLLASHLPEPGSASYTMLQAAGRTVVLDVIPMLDGSVVKHLQFFAGADQQRLARYIELAPPLLTSPPGALQLRLPAEVAALGRKQRRLGI